MTGMTAQARDDRYAFFLRSAKAWQNYFDPHGLLPGIEPSREQITVIKQDEDQLLINGSAGSGKSITLLYKLIKSMQQEEEKQRILYVTFNRTLLDDAKKRAALSPEFEKLKENHKLNMYTFHQMAYHLLKSMGFDNIKPFDATYNHIKKHTNNLIRRVMIIQKTLMESEEYEQIPSSERFYSTQNAEFLLEEILWMKANGYINKEDYFEVERTGRSNNPRLTRAQRKTVYKIFEEYQRQMQEKYHHDLDMEDYALLLLKYFDEIPPEMHYDYIFVDEIQDLQPMQIRVLTRLTEKSIILCGDPKQRIYKNTPHSYVNLGLNIQGRKNRTLTRNFRSTRQIMELAGALKFEDVENEREGSRNFIKEGEKPEIQYYNQLDSMHQHLVTTIKEIIKKDPGSTIAVIHRFEEEIYYQKTPKVKSALERHFYLITTKEYNKKFNYTLKKKPVFFTDVYSIKGLEFDYVFILQFDQRHYPHHKKIENLNQRAEKKGESYNKDYNTILNDEKKLLYVALTRARKKAMLLWNAKHPSQVSPFIQDFNIKSYHASGFDKAELVVTSNNAHLDSLQSL